MYSILVFKSTVSARLTKHIHEPPPPCESKAQAMACRQILQLANWFWGLTWGHFWEGSEAPRCPEAAGSHGSLLEDTIWLLSRWESTNLDFL